MMLSVLPAELSDQAEDLALIYAEAYRQARKKIPWIPSGLDAQ